jgi:hypothetical protein
VLHRLRSIDEVSAPAFAQEAAIVRAAGQVGLDASFTAGLREAAAALRADPTMLGAAQETHHVLFETSDPPEPALARFEGLAGPDTDRLRMLFVLDTVRLLRERHSARGVPAAVTADVIREHPGAWLREARDEEAGWSPTGVGDPPAREWDAEWFRLVAGGTLYRLGRLEFAATSWPHPFRWFRHRRSGESMLVAGEGVPFTADGYLVGDTDCMSTYWEDERQVVANPVWPGGTVSPDRVGLPRSDWEQLLGPGDPVLDVHVPAAGGRLTPDLVRDALEQACPFFGRYHPEHPFVAFFCASWLFSPQLPEILGEGSAIVRWQREGYLCPDKGRPGGVLRWVFGSRSIDPVTAPRDTRLRAGILKLVQAGETLRTGRWLFARQDLPRFGEQPYLHASTRAIRRMLLTGPGHPVPPRQ